jgi:predicted transposase YbfD/YdcC
VLNSSEIFVRLVRPSEEQRFQNLMQEHHYLGALPKISETLWYVASFADQWVALLSFSAPALKCSARDRWIGWTHRHQYDRLKLLTNNSRFLILRDWHLPNLASRILSLCQKRLPTDWQTAFGHPLVLIRVDPLYLDRALQRWNQAYGQEDESLAIEGKTITADALLTQKDIATYLVEQRNASYHFTVKGNQPGVFQDIALYFEDRQAPDFIDCSPPDHGRIEVRKIWTTPELNDYLNFPHVGQSFVVQREFT